MTGFESKRQAAQDKMELADAYASAVAATPNMPTPLERKLAVERIERARNALEAALEQQQAEPDRRALQAEGKHPAPCARHCEAKAFEIEIRSLKSQLKQQAEPVSQAVIAGALFDFMGWLTSRKERLVLSIVDDASPAADAIKVFAKMRGLSLDDARVQDWQNYTAPPQRKELSASEILNMMPSAIPAEYDGELMEFARAIEAKLKERNGY